jgi:hypothetical protein
MTRADAKRFVEDERLRGRVAQRYRRMQERALDRDVHRELTMMMQIGELGNDGDSRKFADTSMRQLTGKPAFHPQYGHKNKQTVNHDVSDDNLYTHDYMRTHNRVQQKVDAQSGRLSLSSAYTRHHPAVRRYTWRLSQEQQEAGDDDDDDDDDGEDGDDDYEEWDLCDVESVAE